MATSKQKEGITTLREKKISSAASSSRRSPDVLHGRRSPRSSVPTTSFSRPEKRTVLSRGPTTASTAVVTPPPTRRPTERSSALSAAATLKERALRAPSSLPKAAASHKHLPEKPSTSSASKSRSSRSSTSSSVVRGRSPGAVGKRTEAKNNGSISRTSSDPGLLELAAISLLGNKIEEAETVSISSIEDHLPDGLPDPVDPKPADWDAPHECKGHETHSLQEICDEEFVAREDGNKSTNEEIKEEDEIAHNSSSEGDPKGESGDEGENKEEGMVVVVVEVKKNTETAQGGKKEAMKSNEVIEETRNKLLERKKSKVKALVGAFETVISLHGSEVQTEHQAREKGGGEMD